MSAGAPAIANDTNKVVRRSSLSSLSAVLAKHPYAFRGMGFIVEELLIPLGPSSSRDLEDFARSQCRLLARCPLVWSGTLDAQRGPSSIAYRNGKAITPVFSAAGCDFWESLPLCKDVDIDVTVSATRVSVHRMGPVLLAVDRFGMPKSAHVVLFEDDKKTECDLFEMLAAAWVTNGLPLFIAARRRSP